MKATMSAEQLAPDNAQNVKLQYSQLYFLLPPVTRLHRLWCAATMMSLQSNFFQIS